MAKDRRRPFARALQISVAAATLATGVTSAAAANHETATILLNFSAGTEPFTPEQARQAVFTGSASANAFHREQSFGALSLTGRGGAASGDVFGWYTVGGSTATCDPDTWMGLADTAASSAGVDLSGYDHRIYIFPHVSACPWAGLADISGPISFINGTLSTRVIAHELGHNLGVHHASSLRCTDTAGAAVPFSTTCSASEYGDPFDVMGSSTRQSSAVTKVRLGYIPRANQATATTSGTYVLAAANLAGGGVQSLRVPRGTTGEFWHFERRATAGIFDNFLATDPAVTGVSVRLAQDVAWATPTKLVDTQPTSASLGDAPLRIGTSFTDPSIPGSPTVTLESVGPLGASVRVQFPGDVPAGGGTPPTGGVPPVGTTPIPPTVTPPSTPVSPTPTATVAVRRINRTSGIVRISVPVTSSTTSCATRIASVRWVRCSTTTRVATITHGFRVRRATVSVAIRLNGAIVLNRRLAIPRVGAKRRVTIAPFRAARIVN